MLIIASERDAVVPKKHSERMYKKPAADKKVTQPLTDEERHEIEEGGDDVKV